MFVSCCIVTLTSKLSICEYITYTTKYGILTSLIQAELIMIDFDCV